MATYYVRMSGSDASAGTSAGAAWRTIGKALGAAGIASGDTVYIGAGVYREAVTVAMTSATSETIIHGDVTGEFTGDAGEVIWTNYLKGWHDTPTTNTVLTLAGRDYLTLRNLTMLAGSSSSAIGGNTVHSSNITIDNCFIYQFGNATAITAVASFGLALNWSILDSIVVSASTNASIAVTGTLGDGSDYDMNFSVRDSVVGSLSGATSIQVSTTGTGANEPGGVDVLGCTFFGGIGFRTFGTSVSLTFPCTIQDSLILCSTAISAAESGAITDLGGNVSTGTYTNAAAHATSKNATEDFPAPLISLGHEWIWGMQPRRAFAPMLPAVLGRGHIGSATTDVEGRARPEGTGRHIDGGTATAGAATTLTDSGKAWGTDEHVGRLVHIVSGTGSGQVKHISSNTATVLTIGGLSGDWATNPSTDSVYIIYEGPPVETNQATSGGTTTFVVSSAAWSTNKWAGYTLEITAGAQSGQSRTISSNTGTTLTTAAFPGAIDNTSIGSIYWPGSSLTAPGDHPGAFEHHDSAVKETAVTDAGSVGIVIDGPGSHEFLIPVDASSTTISVKCRYDSHHGTANKPQAILLANDEIGVTAETKTGAAAADTWETLTFTAQTPSAKGVVTVRLVSRSDTPYGRAYFDTFTVT